MAESGSDAPVVSKPSPATVSDSPVTDPGSGGKFCQTSVTNSIPADSLHIPHNSKSFFLFPTDASEVSMIVRSFDNSWSCGIDEIPIPMIKAVITFIASPLADVIKLSISKGTFPSPKPLECSDGLSGPMSKLNYNKLEHPDIYDVKNFQDLKPPEVYRVSCECGEAYVGETHRGDKD
ncbi:hypothetical protein J437_LFUL017745 [Ladona fulva]|uniref:Uncharacterized protein n=1 Tax=Ladona fulva TaxID=123851 RepID=A0A8K0P9M0_LADFU|nr:hypothetical protein J437_LFUL017745 [Ladona fulva]